MLTYIDSSPSREVERFQNFRRFPAENLTASGNLTLTNLGYRGMAKWSWAFPAEEMNCTTARYSFNISVSLPQPETNQMYLLGAGVSSTWRSFRERNTQICRPALTHLHLRLPHSSRPCPDTDAIGFTDTLNTRGVKRKITWRTSSDTLFRSLSRNR